MDFKTEQEVFWAGKFGRDYISRNESDALLASKTAFWARMLRTANSIESVMEFGCNIGLNLIALRNLAPGLSLRGIEINDEAVARARSAGLDVMQGSIIEPMDQQAQYDLTFTAGVMIHIHPDHLSAVYDNLVATSKRYVLVAEYYNPSPVAIPYRGHAERLFKRDFAGELMDRHGLKLVDYGFVYKRDNWAAQDDITWFLMEKR